jgi:hypothetical protein
MRVFLKSGDMYPCWEKQKGRHRGRSRPCEDEAVISETPQPGAPGATGTWKAGRSLPWGAHWAL